MSVWRSIISSPSSRRNACGVPLGYALLTVNYTALNRLDEAKAAYAQALERKLDNAAFTQNDTGGMARQVAKSTGRPEVENEVLALEADTAAYSGRLQEAREFPAGRWRTAIPTSRSSSKRRPNTPGCHEPRIKNFCECAPAK